MTWPVLTFLPQNTITPWNVESVGMALRAYGILRNGAASAVWPSANHAIYVPFGLVSPIMVRQLFWVNGATASGNVDCGIYGVDNAMAPHVRILSTGSTVQSGTSTIQLVNVADTVIGPGIFYMALAMDNVTGTMFRHLSGAAAGAVARIRSTGMLSQDTAFPLPATSTPAVVSFDYVPLFGLIYSSVAI